MYYLKQLFKWLVLVPVAVLMDVISWIARLFSDVVEYIQDSYTSTFEKLVQWCDKQ